MGDPLRVTVALRLVLDVLMQDPSRPRYGFDLAKATGLKSGSLYPLLIRLEEAGWLESFWEEEADKTSRPRRRYYRLTALGEARASQLLQETPPALARRLQLGALS